jgi:hypothetical protein
LRLPPELYNKVLTLGESLGFDAPADAGRYFLTLGVQQSIGQLSGRVPRSDVARGSSGIPFSTTRSSVASFPDMFPNVGKKTTPAPAAKKGVASVNAKRPARRLLPPKK